MRAPRRRTDAAGQVQEFSEEEMRLWIDGEGIAIFYEKILWPAIMHTAGRNGKMTYWPPSYMAELFRSRKRSGRYNFRGRAISPEDLEALVKNIIYEISQHPKLEWAKGFFFFTEVFGTKHCATYSGEYGSPSELKAWRKMMSCIQTKDDESGRPWPVQGEWWIDSAMEIRHDRMSIVWRKDGHIEVIVWGGGLPEKFARAKVKTKGDGGSLYTLDLNTLLHDIAGFHLEPGGAASIILLRYLQAYTQMIWSSWRWMRGRCERIGARQPM